MCTVIIEVPRNLGEPVRLLAVRDEDPSRPWDTPGEWWPESAPGVIGVRDRRANGAWLAAHPAAGRLAVILNRPERLADRLAPGDAPLASRGELPLTIATGRTLPSPPRTESFNLVAIENATARVAVWNGEVLEQDVLTPGIHMIAHDAVDDLSTPRIARWLPEFRELAGLPAHAWRAAWIEALAGTAALPPEDDRAIIRDNRVHGYPTLSLLACLAEVHAGGDSSIALECAVLEQPAHWCGESFTVASV